MSTTARKTPPMTVPSPDEKGGRLGEGLAALPHKKMLCCATETPNKELKSNSALGEDG
jgi:hypothetical protein